MRSREAFARHAEVRPGAALLLLLTLLPAASCKAGPGAAAPHAEHRLEGAPAPDFEIPAHSGGEQLSPSAHSGKVVIVDFWATWCEPCKQSFPFYQTLTDKYAGRLSVLAVSVDEEPDAIASFVAQTGVRFLVGWDEGQVVARLYEPQSMPTSYIVDQNGVVRHVHAGFRAGDEAAITEQLELLLK